MRGHFLRAGKSAGGAAPGGLLLDDYPGAACAYSLRQLRTGVASVVQVRRSSDDALADFTAAEVVDGTLTSWVGGGDGFVRTLYDHSLSGHDLQPSAVPAREPMIVQAGVLVATPNGSPAIMFDGTTSDLRHNITGNWQSSFCVTRYDKGVTFSSFDGLFTGNFDVIGLIGSSGGTSFYPGWGTSLFLNGQQIATNAAVLPTINQLALLEYSRTTAHSVPGLVLGTDRQDIGARNWGGPIAEFVTYPADMSVDRADIAANINSHYAIF